MRSLCLLVLIQVLISTGFAYLDNYIIGTPKVICEENDVSLDVLTAKPFQGNIFVKGRAKDEQCRKSYSSNATKSYSLGLGKCGMTRLRSANPRGVNFAITVVVSFHPSGFITKNDRAFKVQCFYNEPEEIVTNSVQVSSLPTQELSDEMAMPTCAYSVRSGSYDGPLLNFANVGETLFHVWECKGVPMGMLVKKCFVTDGDGDEHLVIDEHGCTVDPSLLDNIVYDESLMRAHAQSQAFKYADSNQLFFTCQIRLCQKQMSMCDGVTVSATVSNVESLFKPPKCHDLSTKTSSINKVVSSTSKSDDYSVEEARELENSLDTNSTPGASDFIVIERKRNRRELMKLNSIELDVATPQLFIVDQDENIYASQICISRTLLSLLPFSLLTILFFTIAATVSCYKQCFIPRKSLFY